MSIIKIVNDCSCYNVRFFFSKQDKNLEKQHHEKSTIRLLDFPTQCYQHVFEHLSQIHHFRHEISFGVPEKRKICLHSFYINIKLVNAGVTQPHAIRAGLFQIV